MIRVFGGPGLLVFGGSGALPVGGWDVEMFCMYRWFIRRNIFVAVLAMFLCIMGCTEGEQQDQLAPPLQTEEFPLKISTPQEHGLDPERIEQAMTQANALGFIRSVLILRNGELVHESYSHRPM